MKKNFFNNFENLFTTTQWFDVATIALLTFAAGVVLTLSFVACCLSGTESRSVFADKAAAADAYIQELEEQLQEENVLDDTVMSGDAYWNYHKFD